jgi:hypothetical protein
VGEYLTFCELKNHPQPKGIDSQDLNKPITNISYKDAETYAKSFGKELPTQAEWEKFKRPVNSYFRGNNQIQNSDDNIKKETTINSKKATEILRFIVGDEISNHILNSNFAKDKWRYLNNDQKQKIYLKSEIYIDIYSNKFNLPTNPDLMDSNNSKIGHQLLRMIAYSSAIGGFNKKSQFLKRIQDKSLSLEDVKRLFEIFYDETIRLYILSLDDESVIVNEWDSEKRIWKMLLDNLKWGVETITDGKSISEYICDNKFISMQDKNINLSSVSDIEKPVPNVGFRCVIPVYNNNN